jgi:peroxiredoxin
MNNLIEVDWSTLPAPEDDGASHHLTGMSLPSVSLWSTAGSVVDLSHEEGLLVVYAYPMTGQPGVDLPDGWDLIPGARGCTPQSCAFRDHAQQLAGLGVNQVFGVSSQSRADQQEAATRLRLPFQLLSDEHHLLADALRLPTFEVDDKRLLKRLTFVVLDNTVVKVFYPVFPPDSNSAVVMKWLKSQPSIL